VEEVRYMISEVAKQVEVEDHVLRYWQKQLDLPISRNEMKQRYYKDTDIELLKKVKELKERGFQLKAIKMLLKNPNMPEMIEMDEKQLLEENQCGKEQIMPEEERQADETKETSLVAEEQNHEIAKDEDSKMNQFKTLLNHIILNALKENNGVLAKEIGINVSDQVIREMNYMMRVQEEKEEERFRKFDAALRDYQKSRMMSAATIEHKRRKSKFFKKNKIYI
jgi:DNA-binding transcriptional MerR regulator